MKNNRNLRGQLLIVAGVITTLLLPLPAFSGGSTAAEEIKIEADGLIICPEPRPQICTMNYLPVCAQLQDGSNKVYSNGCSSCSDPNVVGYRDGECPAEK